MRICENGVIRDMTQEEIEYLELLDDNHTEPTADERLEALENAMLELMGVDVDG